MIWREVLSTYKDIWEENDPGKPYDKLKMPTFYLSDREVDAIVTWVIANRFQTPTERLRRLTNGPNKPAIRPDRAGAQPRTGKCVAGNALPVRAAMRDGVRVRAGWSGGGKGGGRS